MTKRKEPPTTIPEPAIADANLFEHEFLVFVKKVEGKHEQGDSDDVDQLNVHVDLQVIDHDDALSILSIVQQRSREPDDGKRPANAAELWLSETREANGKRTTFDREFTDHKVTLRVGAKVQVRLANVTLNAFAIDHVLNGMTLKMHGMKVTGVEIGSVSELLGGRAKLILQRGTHWKSQQELELEQPGDANDE